MFSMQTVYNHSSLFCKKKVNKLTDISPYFSITWSICVTKNTTACNIVMINYLAVCSLKYVLAYVSLWYNSLVSFAWTYETSLCAALRYIVNIKFSCG